ncbi:hypothetical protein JMJ35_006683 [Cladonia borealis]|uniref:Rhodopsin domain-containing protein n=1 Tax=Cladonia borealis TaxID=184061 RepID=A0AA39R0D9_9LECA|nr:hypothetical protein JMJ35_006683 [Cladonia borealis]
MASLPTPLPPGTVPSGQAAPVEVTNATHHGGWVVITAALGLTFGIVCLLIRLYVRFIISPPFTRDDYVHSIATAFAFLQSIVVFFAVSKGFGTSIELLGQGDINTVQRAWVAGDILFLITLYLSKCSLGFLFIRLTPHKIHNKASYAVLGLCTLWVIVSAFVISVNCELNHPWTNISAQCTNMLARWQFVTTLDIVVELILVCLAAVLVHDLKMPLTKKAMVVLAFLFRLPLIAFALLRLHNLATGIRSPNPTLDLVGAVVWAEIELHYANIAATMPCLRPFMAAVSTEYGATDPRTALGSKVYGSSSGDRKGGASYILSSFGSGGRKEKNYSNIDTTITSRMSRKGTSRMNSDISPNDRSNNETTIVHEGKHDDVSIGSNDSRKMIIKKKIDIRVHRGEAGENDEEAGVGRDTTGGYI